MFSGIVEPERAPPGVFFERRSGREREGLPGFGVPKGVDCGAGAFAPPRPRRTPGSVGVTSAGVCVDISSSVLSKSSMRLRRLASISTASGNSSPFSAFGSASCSSLFSFLPSAGFSPSFLFLSACGGRRRLRLSSVAFFALARFSAAAPASSLGDPFFCSFGGGDAWANTEHARRTNVAVATHAPRRRQLDLINESFAAVMAAPPIDSSIADPSGSRRFVVAG